jgi:hypothetical protein
MEFTESLFQPELPAEPIIRKVRFLRVAHPILKDQTRDYVLEIPRDVDVDKTMAEYLECNGRVYIQDGEVLDHNTLELDTWLVTQKGARFIIDQQTD